MTTLAISIYWEVFSKINGVLLLKSMHLIPISSVQYSVMYAMMKKEIHRI